MEPGDPKRFKHGVKSDHRPRPDGCRHQGASPRHTARRHARFLALLSATLLAGCAATPPRAPDVPLLAGYPEYTVPDVDLLRVSPEMRAFADRYARNSDTNDSRAWMLAYAALDPYILDFEYEPQVDLPADEAFRVRRGNCLTFSSLFVALARNAGLTAWYQEVRVPPQWSAVNETLLVSKHVNAVVREWGQSYVIDVSRRKKTERETAYRISDREAKAQYYNNLGADSLVNEDLAGAHAYFRKALETEPSLAYVWSNLGVVLRRNGQIDDAIMAYQAALRADPDQAVALNNLFDLYTEEGHLEAAAAIEARVERNRRRNPYYLHHLAETAIEERRWYDAIDLLERAIDIDGSEYRFHYSLAQSQFHLGRKEGARASLDRARELAPPAPAEGPLTLPDEG